MKHRKRKSVTGIGSNIDIAGGITGTRSADATPQSLIKKNIDYDVAL